MNKRTSWLKKKYGFDNFPKSISNKKLFNIFYHALSRNKLNVASRIIKEFPDFHNFDYGLPTIIYNLCPSFLEPSFKLGLHPDSAKSPFLCLVHDNPTFVELGIKYQANLEATNEDGEVALGYAAAWGDLETIKLLLDAGANINFIEDINSTYKYTPLDSAHDNKEIYDYLVSQGAKHYKELKNNI